MGMKTVILSDLHLGSKASVLGTAAADQVGQSHADYLKNKLFSKLRAELSPKSPGDRFILVSAGDTLDFSLQDYTAAFTDGQSFFKALAAEELFDDIILLAGNHDHNIWQMVQLETVIVDRLRKGQVPGEFKHIRGALLDLAADKLVIPGVTNVPEERNSDSFFIQGLFGDVPSDKRPKLWVVYPSLFIQPPVAADEAASPILVTHGHFFSLPWVLLTTVFPKSLKIDRNCTIAQLEQLNSPLTEMAWTALGQAGTLTEAARSIYDSMAKGETKAAQAVLDELGDYFDNDVWKYKAINPKEWATDALIFTIKKFLLHLIDNGVKSAGDHKEDHSFLNSDDNQKRIETYLDMSNVQYADLLKSNNPAANPGTPSMVVFGHTHVVIDPAHTGPQGVKFLNTGGFMQDVDTVEATAVIVDESGQVRSVKVWP